MSEIKGNELFNQKRFILKNYGEETLKKILEKTGQKTREIYESPIISGEWYPLENYLDFIDAFENAVSVDARRAFDMEDARVQMNSLYRLIIRFIPQKEIYKRIQSMWDEMFSEGKIYAKEIGKDNVILRLENFRTSKSHIDGLALYFAKVGESISNRKVGVKYHIIDDSTAEFRMFERTDMANNKNASITS